MCSIGGSSACKSVNLMKMSPQSNIKRLDKRDKNWFEPLEMEKQKLNIFPSRKLTVQ